MSNENIAPAVLRRIMTEIADLTRDPPEDIKLIITEDISDIQAIIQGPEGTPYEGGCFKVMLKLSADFPQVPPKGFFITKIFHPNVSEKGEICVNTLKKDWKEDLGIKHVLLTIKCLLIDPNPESALNEEAGRLLLERYEDYASHAKLITSIYAKPTAEATGETCNENSEEIIINNSSNTSENNNNNSSKKNAKNTKKKAPVKKNLKRL